TICGRSLKYGGSSRLKGSVFLVSLIDGSILQLRFRVMACQGFQSSAPRALHDCDARVAVAVTRTGQVRAFGGIRRLCAHLGTFQNPAVCLDIGELQRIVAVGAVVDIDESGLHLVPAAV